ncbi:hypothetical protein WKW82_33950 [Variovorax rhizosphaerae]|uniref:EamA domain-containing protein n=1 Tax=Variovorax rhizosphaerae TaxID=1836200 RepID=A0ABU8WY30_9BURK
MSGAEAALFTAILPVSALVLAALWLGDCISAAQIAGALCVLGVVALASRGESGSKRPERPSRALGL